MGNILKGLIRVGAAAGALAAVVGLLKGWAELRRGCPEQSSWQCVTGIVSGHDEKGLSDNTKLKIKDYIQWTFLQNKEAYDTSVDYYGMGVVSRDVVLKEQENEARRYKVRTFKLKDGPLDILVLGPDRYSVTFDYEFSKAREHHLWRVTGSGREQVMLRREGDRFVVNSVKEVVERGK